MTLYGRGARNMLFEIQRFSNSEKISSYIIWDIIEVQVKHFVWMYNRSR